MLGAELIVAVWAVTSGQLTGQEAKSFSGQRFHPARSKEGLIDADWAATAKHLEWDLTLLLNFARNPIVLYDESGAEPERAGSLLRDRLDANLLGAIALWDRLELGLDIDIAVFQARDDRIDFGSVSTSLATISVGGIGDIRFTPKFTIFDDSDPVAVGVQATLVIPSGGSDNYLGDTGVAVQPTLLVSKAAGPARMTLNVGYMLRSRVETLRLIVDDEIAYNAAVGVRFLEISGVPAELDLSGSGSFSVERPFEKAAETPFETIFAGRYEVNPALEAFIGVGFGIGRGFGTPDTRVIGGVRWSGRERDKDGDGIMDTLDSCPDEPEDKDGFQDTDGCPESDNDGDGILDTADACRDSPEDKDNFEDTDGCPEEDNDKDTVLDRDDACPNEAGVVENKGCPDKDTDGDTIVDRKDGCPAEPEDKDGFEDEDGCPDLDNDNDGVVDAKDRCPMEPGPLENQGCPDADRDGDGIVDRLDNCPDQPGPADNQGCQKKQYVQITSTQLKILDKVYFATASATILARSFALLNNVAEVIKAHPEIVSIHIEGHTDSRGSADYNLKLSQKRADSVRAYIIGRGIEPTRVESKGYGEERPLIDQETPAAWQENRRVEFNIPQGAGGGAMEGGVDRVIP